jgi:hypothetical protein
LLFALIALAYVACAPKKLNDKEASLYHELAYNTAYNLETEHICHIHHIPTELRKDVLLQGGLCVEVKGYQEARFKKFPNSFNFVATCDCQQSESICCVQRWVCPKCRALEKEWLAEFWAMHAR